MFLPCPSRGSCICSLILVFVSRTIGIYFASLVPNGISPRMQSVHLSVVVITSPKFHRNLFSVCRKRRKCRCWHETSGQRDILKT